MPRDEPVFSDIPYSFSYALLINQALWPALVSSSYYLKIVDAPVRRGGLGAAFVLQGNVIWLASSTIYDTIQLFP